MVLTVFFGVSDRDRRRRPPRHRATTTPAPSSPSSASRCPNFWLGIMLILLFGVALRLAADLGLRGLASPDPPRRDAGRLPHRARRAPHPLEHARDPEPGLHPHRPGQGPGRAGGRAPPRAPERRHPRAHRHRAPDRDAARRRRHHRVGVRVARDGQAHRRRHLLPRLPGGADRPDPRRRPSSWRSTWWSTCSTR